MPLHLLPPEKSRVIKNWSWVERKERGSSPIGSGVGMGITVIDFSQLSARAFLGNVHFCFMNAFTLAISLQRQAATHSPLSLTNCADSLSCLDLQGVPVRDGLERPIQPVVPSPKCAATFSKLCRPSSPEDMLGCGTAPQKPPQPMKTHEHGASPLTRVTSGTA